MEGFWYVATVTVASFFDHADTESLHGIVLKVTSVACQNAVKLVNI